jgi:hypothetical protein
MIHPVLLQRNSSFSLTGAEALRVETGPVSLALSLISVFWTVTVWVGRLELTMTLLVSTRGGW